MKTESAPLIAYKAFEADWTCRGFQYELGKTYTHEGPVNLCKAGFHACEYPLDVFNYYPPTGPVALVEMAGVDPKTDSDSKRASRSITIKAALTIRMLVSAAIEWTLNRCEPAKAAHATGYRSASSATGDQSASSATGYQSASSATGDNAVAAAFGVQSKAMAGKTDVVVVAWWCIDADPASVTHVPQAL